ncbi:MAG: DMT family transporter [Pseudomonadota bacterium]
MGGLAPAPRAGHRRDGRPPCSASGHRGADGRRPLCRAWDTGIAGRDLATRAAPARLSTWQLGVYGFAALVVAGALLLAITGGAALPDLSTIAAILAATLVGVLAYALLTAATRIGDVSAVTPFRYTRLVFGVALGMIVFGEHADGWTLGGAALIVGAGLYSLLREARLSGRARP